MMDPEEIPTNRLFDEGIIFSSHLFNQISKFSVSWEDIDWEQEIDVPEGIQQVLTSAATQFQYGNMSHLILCGKIIKNEAQNTTMDAQKLSVVLAAYRLEGIELWGRYVEKTGAGAIISPELQRYYQHLFSEDDVLHILLGIEVLGGPLVQAVYDRLQGEGDAVFDQIVTNLHKQKTQEIDMSKKFLRQMIRANNHSSQAALEDTFKKYREIADQILESNTAALEGLDIDPGELRLQTSKEIDDYAEELGIYR